MNRLKRNAWISVVLGTLSLVAIVFCGLALLDVYHGESDLSLEWGVVRVSLATILVFNVFALGTLFRFLAAPGD